MAESLYAWRPQLVLGFHGCSEKIRDTFVTDRFSEIIESENDYDWLGPGMYFWENDYERALEWAEKKYPENPAVVGSYIELGLCLDFMSSASLDLLKPAYESIESETLPENTDDMLRRPRDCAVIMAIHQARADSNEERFDTVRGVFWEGKEPYPGAGFKQRNHVQIAVRNPDCIKGFFLPRMKSGVNS